LRDSRERRQGLDEEADRQELLEPLPRLEVQPEGAVETDVRLGDPGAKEKRSQPRQEEEGEGKPS
jgi:hypothetical protein